MVESFDFSHSVTDYSPSVENVALYKTLRVKFKEGLKLHDECMIRFAKTEIPEIFNKLARKLNEKREHLVLQYVVKAEGGKEISITVKYEPESELMKEEFEICYSQVVSMSQITVKKVTFN